MHAGTVRAVGERPTARNIFLPAPVPGFRREPAEAQRGTNRQLAPGFLFGCEATDRCGAEESFSAIQPATQKYHNT